MKKIFLISAIFLGVAQLGASQAMAADGFVCTIKPATKPFYRASPIPEFLTVEFDPHDKNKIVVTDSISLAYTGGASSGILRSRNAKMSNYSWSVPLLFSDGVGETVIYTLRVRNKDGKSTLSMTGNEMLGGVFGRGRCVTTSS